MRSTTVAAMRLDPYDSLHNRMQTTLKQPLNYEPARPVAPRDETRAGLMYGLGAYLSWGVVAMYFKLLTHVPALTVLANRIVWSALFLAIVTAVRGSTRELREPLRRRDVLWALAGSTFLIAVNWYTFIYAIEADALLHASLGYFINPLVSVLLGFVFLRERLRPWQLVGLALAAAGVAILTVRLGTVPWIALILAVSFGFYGLLRKVMQIGAMAGLTVETWLLFVPSLVVIIVYAGRDPARFASLSIGTHVLLALAGVVTAVPLLMFAAAARRLRLATMGFMQYIAPTCQFLLAVFLYDEPFTRAHMLTFGLIWAALLAYTLESYVDYRRRSAPPPAPTVEPEI
jgi:chloramphenicol-sensitive protein RarD